jgi:hypothetical protein
MAMQAADEMNDKTNLPICCVEMKHQAAARVQIATVPTSIVPTARAASDSSSAGGISSVEVVHTSVQQNQLLWAKVTSSKALKEITNIAKKIAKMEELGQGMTLSEKMRVAIGPSFDDEFTTRVRT